MYTEQLTQALSIQGQIAPVSQGVGTVQPTAGVDMSRFRRAMFILNVGVFGASASVDMKLQESNNANLSAATDLAGNNVAITQLTAGGGNNRLATLEARASQMTKRYLGVLVTVGTAATLVQVTCLGGEAIDKPGSALDIAAVAQRNVAS